MPPPSNRREPSARVTAPMLALVLLSAPAAAREMSTDRPDRTESPYTVDTGRLQLELEGVAYSRDHDRGTAVDAWEAGTVNLKVGVASTTDLQLTLQTWGEERVTRPGSPSEVSRGVGSFGLRLKHNLVGNDEGTFALGVMPFVEDPIRDGYDSARLAGGVIVPMAWSVGPRWDIGAMAEADVRPDDDLDGHHAEWIASATAGRDWTPAIGTYVELYSRSSSEPGARWVGTLDAGFRISASENLTFDAGGNFGISREAEDVVLFVGVSVRR